MHVEHITYVTEIYLVSCFYCTFIQLFRLFSSGEFPGLLHPATCSTFSLTCLCLTFIYLTLHLMVAQFSVSPYSVVVLVGVRENPFYFAQSNKLEASVCTCLLRGKKVACSLFVGLPDSDFQPYLNLSFLSCT